MSDSMARFVAMVGVSIMLICLATWTWSGSRVQIGTVSIAVYQPKTYYAPMYNSQHSITKPEDDQCLVPCEVEPRCWR